MLQFNNDWWILRLCGQLDKGNGIVEEVSGKCKYDKISYFTKQFRRPYFTIRNYEALGKSEIQ